MIQGKSVRLILKKEATPDDIRHADGMPEININETTPRFEDAFIDLLGGAGTSESPLGAILHTVEGTPGETVIEAKELTKKFGDFAATDHVNFAVKRGEIFGLLGPNGAGKSTLFRMISGQEQPDSGTITLGETVKLASVDQFRDSMDNSKTVWEEVSGGLDIMKIGSTEMPSRA
ncbi:ATP-binding cassette domain-containing protein, partial [Providencia rettgeri]